MIKRIRVNTNAQKTFNKQIYLFRTHNNGLKISVTLKISNDLYTGSSSFITDLENNTVIVCTKLVGLFIKRFEIFMFL